MTRTHHTAKQNSNEIPSRKSIIKPRVNGLINAFPRVLYKIEKSHIYRTRLWKPSHTHMGWLVANNNDKNTVTVSPFLYSGKLWTKEINVVKYDVGWQLLLGLRAGNGPYQNKFYSRKVSTKGHKRGPETVFLCTFRTLEGGIEITYYRRVLHFRRWHWIFNSVIRNIGVECFA